MSAPGEYLIDSHEHKSHLVPERTGVSAVPASSGWVDPSYFMPLRQCLSELFLNRNSTCATQELRTAEQPRLLWRSPGPGPLLKQEHLQLTAQGHAQVTFEYYQGCRPHHFSRQPVTVFDHFHSIEGFSIEIPCISVCSHCLLSYHWAPLGRVQLNLIYTFSSCTYW